MRRDLTGETSERLSLIVGLAAVVFSGLYFASDLIELAQGGFSTVQLALTFAAEAAIPLFVVGAVCAAAADRAGVLPHWTGVTLMAGVVLVSLSSGLAELAQTASAGHRDLAFGGMGPPRGD